MIYPVKNFKTEWNMSAGYEFGQKTSYGLHDGTDINDNGGGNSDLGKPLYAIAKGTVLGIHSHTSANTFGNHFFLQIEGPWGIRYVHYAHCQTLLITQGQVVNEGQQVATVGNSGTVYAHCHFAVKKKANGMDTVCLNIKNSDGTVNEQATRAFLDDAWEDSIKFIEKYMAPPPISVDQKVDKIKNIVNGGGTATDKLKNIDVIIHS